jgi:hypothetical protein
MLRYCCFARLRDCCVERCVIVVLQGCVIVLLRANCVIVLLRANCVVVALQGCKAARLRNVNNNKTEKSFSNIAASQFCFSRSNKSTTTLQF